MDSNIRIVKNQIYGLYSNATSQGVSGIRVSLGNPISPRRLLIANNSIAKIATVNGSNAFGSMGTYTTGILVEVAKAIRRNIFPQIRIESNFTIFTSNRTSPEHMTFLST